MTDVIRAAVEQISKKLTDDGLIIDAGFVGFRKLVINPQATERQVNEMRLAFFAGAQHVFGSIMTILDPGEEPTDADLFRMDAINKELQQFADEFILLTTQTKGTS